MKITRDTIYRALKTFIQSALAYMTVNVMYVNFSGNKLEDKTAILGLLVATLSAGFAGIMNLEKEDEDDI